MLHVDLDAFYASVEQRDKPSLRGKPVVVGGTAWRGVVATASYEARAFGVGSAMPTAAARRACPWAAYLHPRFAAYRAASARVMALLAELAGPPGLLEPLSLDEAYVELTASSSGPDDEAVLAAAAAFRERVRIEVGLTASVGVGTSKLVAKIASDLRKPDALLVVPAGAERTVLAPLGVRALPGVGPATEARLATLGVSTVGQLAATDERELVSLLGRASGTALHAAALGLDPRPVVPEREAKSVSAEETFTTDVVDRGVLAAELARMAARVADRLLASGLRGRTVTVKARRYDFSTLARSATTGPGSGGAGSGGVATAEEIVAAATPLLAAIDATGGLRLLGVGVSGLVGALDGLEEPIQGDLLAELDAPLVRAAEGDHSGHEHEGRDDDDDGGDVPPPPPPPAEHPEVLERPGRTAVTWIPGQDVVHVDHGMGWVQGSGVGRVTVRFEGPHTGVGRVRTFAVDDPDLAPTDPPEWVTWSDRSPTGRSR
ncbi:DNA polymerase-4 [Quadrisphaera granulorum]|uniref:DNA polymerase IV n=1 Tax=Quadrisphaera granulorum TaxID=317664 RepID=A0A316AEU9_9ACTN|nr:DNA polymerase-4 [Quadrisphaera granulorum]SZE95295.1 DNA polymerase-4 [Quadrisphaera granulorum]